MKLKHLLLIPLLLLTSCNSNVDTSSLKIVCPTGAPAICFYKESENSNFETNSTPSNIVSMMNSNSDKDIVVIDTVSGIKAINNGAPYKICANITLGNFFIASTGLDEDNIMNEGDTIILFGQNQTPDYLFHYLFEDKFDDSIEYVTNVQDASKCLASGKNLITKSNVDYVFIAQPALYTILNNKEALTYGKSSIYMDVQEEYKKKSNGLSIIQASIFVKEASDSKVVNSYLKELKKNIELAINNPEVIAEPISKIGEELALSLYGVNLNVAKNVLSDNNKLGLGYISAKENKQAIDNFINLFGVEDTNEEIYY